MATGWLGWTPDIVLDTPLAQLTLALEGKFDFIRKTNPWRSNEDVEADELAERMEALNESGPDLEGIADTFSTLAAIAKPLPQRSKPKTDG